MYICDWDEVPEDLCFPYVHCVQYKIILDNKY